MRESVTRCSSKSVRAVMRSWVRSAWTTRVRAISTADSASKSSRGRAAPRSNDSCSSSTSRLACSSSAFRSLTRACATSRSARTCRSSISRRRASSSASTCPASTRCPSRTGRVRTRPDSRVATFERCTACRSPVTMRRSCICSRSTASTFTETAGGPPPGCASAAEAIPSPIATATRSEAVFESRMDLTLARFFVSTARGDSRDARRVGAVLSDQRIAPLACRFRGRTDDPREACSPPLSQPLEESDHQLSTVISAWQRRQTHECRWRHAVGSSTLPERKASHSSAEALL